MGWWNQPFGPLQGLHDNIISNAKPVTWLNPWEIVIRFIPLLLQALLLQYEGTRPYRMAISIPAAVIMARAAIGYRFDGPEYTAYNYIMGIAWMHLIIASYRFGFIKEPIIDPYASQRSRFFRAFDLIANIRWLGLRPIDFPITSTSETVPSEKISTEHNGHGPQQNGDSRSKSAPLVPAKKKEKVDVQTRPQALLYHFWTFLPHYITITIIIHLLRHYGRGTVDKSYITLSEVDQFQNRQFYLFPNSSMVIPIPVWVNGVVIEVSVGIMIWSALVAGYNFVAMSAIGSGIYEPDSWIPNLFEGNPWAEESLLGFWKSWHQIFRQDFIHVSSLILWPLSQVLPRSILRPLQVLLPFTVSGLMHSLGLYLTEPTPRPWPLFVFFFQHGLGCISEILFHRLTGKKVRGIFGLIWKFVFIGVTGYPPMRALMAGGFGGCALIIDIGTGKIIGDFIIRYILDTTTA